ncbi:hypothetical protein MKZ38_000986 [Zalerion maritima]|uniref:Uncharacterized protein n=1 Tax=Zalerion maritima TaxID=339359 RepID=A0AAD5RS89_9PEZI|nr:hypothetical protein MKZ38_000986 [Zalerion maritima]
MPSAAVAAAGKGAGDGESLPKISNAVVRVCAAAYGLARFWWRLSILYDDTYVSTNLSITLDARNLASFPPLASPESTHPVATYYGSQTSLSPAAAASALHQTRDPRVSLPHHSSPNADGDAPRMQQCGILESRGARLDLLLPCKHVKTCSISALKHQETFIHSFDITRQCSLVGLKSKLEAMTTFANLPLTNVNVQMSSPVRAIIQLSCIPVACEVGNVAYSSPDSGMDLARSQRPHEPSRGGYFILVQRLYALLSPSTNAHVADQPRASSQVYPTGMSWVSPGHGVWGIIPMSHSFITPPVKKL